MSFVFAAKFILLPFHWLTTPAKFRQSWNQKYTFFFFFCPLCSRVIFHSEINLYLCKQRHDEASSFIKVLPVLHSRSDFNISVQTYMFPPHACLKQSDVTGCTVRPFSIKDELSLMREIQHVASPAAVKSDKQHGVFIKHRSNISPTRKFVETQQMEDRQHCTFR